jgi:hypothetical protein
VGRAVPTIAALIQLPSELQFARRQNRAQPLKVITHNLMIVALIEVFYRAILTPFLFV